MLYILHGTTQYDKISFMRLLKTEANIKDALYGYYIMG